MNYKVHEREMRTERITEDLVPHLVSPCDPSIKNIVATINLGIRIKLEILAKKCKNTEYNPKRFSAAVIRIKEPRSTALVFTTGKMVVTGSKTVEESKAAARTFAKLVRRCGFEATFKEFRVQNMVSVAEVNFPIRLEALQIQHENFCHYEPEVFPGAIYRLMRPKVVLLIFVSGRIVITGARGKEDTKKAFDSIYPVLTQFQKRAVLSKQVEPEHQSLRNEKKEVFERILN